MAMCAVSQLVMTRWMVTEMMRWVTSGGTPAVEPWALIVLTTSEPLVTCPNKEYPPADSRRLSSRPRREPR